MADLTPWPPFPKGKGEQLTTLARERGLLPDQHTGVRALGWSSWFAEAVE